MDDQPTVRMSPPPKPVLRVVNPVIRRLLLSPLAGLLPPAMVVLELTGRRSGRPLVIPVGLHELPEGRVVFSEAPWRLNFAGGRELVVRRGRERRHGAASWSTTPSASPGASPPRWSASVPGGLRCTPRPVTSSRTTTCRGWGATW